MTERLHIEIVGGPLPEGKERRITATAEELAETLVTSMEEAHGIKLAFKVRAVTAKPESAKPRKPRAVRQAAE